MNRLIERLAAILALGLMVGPGHAEGMSGQGGDSNTFLALIDSIRHADYRGDRTELRRLAAQLSALSLPKHRAHQEYWVGFAWWRRAINGFNETPVPEDLMADLERCEEKNRAALSLSPEFEDALNAVVSCLGIQLGLSASGPGTKSASILARGSLFFRQIRDRKTLTTNPRTLWVLSSWEAGPPSIDIQKAVDSLLRGLELARAEPQRRQGFTRHPLAHAQLSVLSALFAVSRTCRK